RWIVGEYRDSDGRKNIITCDPADEWDVPPENQYMDESWSIPLRVGVAGVFEVINGRIDIDFLPEKESLINMSLLLDFEVGNVYYRAYRRQIDETSIQWIFLYPDKGMTWTKTEP
ncbi:MAG: hypothetical protein GX444_19705, partial [Myxococcales bacterium]|nr:hypothetical protein [Myxococcales bacterium]